MGLLLMRLAAGAAVMARAAARLRGGPTIESVILEVLAITAGILLLAGLWTPVSGSVLAGLELWNVISQSGDPWFDILLAAVAAGLALVGPGAWSIDSRLFGWKRIDVRDRRV